MKLSWKYPKIMSVYERDKKTHKFLIGRYSTPEIKYLKYNQWIFTEKVNGKNIRIKYNGEEIIYTGRSEESHLELLLVYKLDELFKSFEGRQRLEKVFPSDPNFEKVCSSMEEMEIYLYGEGYGDKIQKGGENYIKDSVDFVLFDVCINGIWLERNNVDDIANKLSIKSVPIIGQGTLEDAINMTKKGFKSQWGDFIAEGIVLRPKVELFTRKGERVITKVKYKDFH